MSRLLRQLVLFMVILGLVFFEAIAQEEGLVSGSSSSGVVENEEDIIRQLISDSGSVIPDVESNTILVVDYPANIAMVEEYLKVADIPTEQILIEARVVEVKLEKEHAFGVNWSLLTGESDAELAGMRVFGTDAAGNNARGYQQQLTQRPIKWEPLSGIDQTSWTLGLTSSKLDVVLTALTTQLESNIISAPKVTAKNNRRAKIDVMKTRPYLSEIEKEETGEGADMVTTFTYIYDYADEGVSMEVIPVINEDRSITMSIVPQVKEIVRWHDQVVPTGVNGTPQLPETDVRIAQTKVTVDEGQTLVIGGLINESIQESTTKVPLLGDLPFVGALFRSEKEITEKKELLILVSPTIITPRSSRDMARQERYGVGKWYADGRKIISQEIDKAEQKEQERLNNYIENLKKKLGRLTKKRKKLQDEVNKNKTLVE